MTAGRAIVAQWPTRKIEQRQAGCGRINEQGSAEALASGRQRFLMMSALLDAKGVTLQLHFFEGRNDLTTVFSGLLTVILIGLVVVIFRAIEARTVNLWAMQR